MVIYKIFVFGADRKSNMAARAHNMNISAKFGSNLFVVSEKNMKM
jgi:hypothetical protein